MLEHIFYIVLHVLHVLTENGECFWMFFVGSMSSKLMTWPQGGLCLATGPWCLTGRLADLLRSTSEHSELEPEHSEHLQGAKMRQGILGIL